MTTAGRAAGQRANIDWDNVPDLGSLPDRAIAERLGVTTTAVRSARSSRGIPPYHRYVRRQVVGAAGVVARLVARVEQLRRELAEAERDLEAVHSALGGAK